MRSIPARSVRLLPSPLFPPLLALRATARAPRDTLLKKVNPGSFSIRQAEGLPRLSGEATGELCCILILTQDLGDTTRSSKDFDVASAITRSGEVFHSSLFVVVGSLHPLHLKTRIF